MTVTTVNAVKQIEEQLKSSDASNKQIGEASFTDVLKQAINNVNQTDAIAQNDTLRIAAGQADDLHTITMNIAKADLALQTLVLVRNKAIDAYNEVMRISL